VDPTVGPTAEVAVFAAISAGGLVLTTLLMTLFRGHLGLPVMGAKVISSLLVFLWNFLGRKLILYPGKKHKKA
jgi:putative flippase GtrA